MLFHNHKSITLTIFKQGEKHFYLINCFSNSKFIVSSMTVPKTFTFIGDVSIDHFYLNKPIQFENSRRIFPRGDYKNFNHIIFVWMFSGRKSQSPFRFHIYTTIFCFSNYFERKMGCFEIVSDILGKLKCKHYR